MAYILLFVRSRIYIAKLTHMCFEDDVNSMLRTHDRMALLYSS